MQPAVSDYDVCCLREHTLLSIYQRTNALDTIQNNTNHKIQLNTSIKLLRVSPQGANFRDHYNKGIQAQIPVDGTSMPKRVGV
jgi:hypothetical protein